MSGVSALQLAKRALVSVLLRLAAVYRLAALGVTRESADKEVESAFRKVVRRVHPDKGGKKEHAQDLNAAKEKWDKARTSAPGASNARAARATPGAKVRLAPPKATASHGHVASMLADQTPGGFRINSTAVMLTYNGITGVKQWSRFNTWVRGSSKEWGLCRWTSTLEQTKRGLFHIHVMFQFLRKIDRRSKYFTFEGVPPNAQPNGVGTDLCGEGICRKKAQQSVDRGMFYVWADKIGTVRDAKQQPCRDGNYSPAWTETREKYQVKGAWPETLWKQYKLTHDVFEDYLYKCRDGVVVRKRNFDAVVEREKAAKQQGDMQRIVKRIKSDASIYRPFPPVPAAVEWKKVFETYRLRYPILLVLGPSHSGKTEWAMSLFRNPLKLLVGALPFFPDGMRRFDRTVNDGLVLDDVRDLQFLADNQEKLQGKYDTVVEFASTPGGQCSFAKYLFACPVVVTANYSTANLDFLETHDWLKNPCNRVLVQWPSAGAAAPAEDD